jgi:hypothetical protein
MACSRVGYAYTCVECWPRNSARWCNSCFERFGPKRASVTVPPSACTCPGPTMIDTSCPVHGDD